MKFPITYSQRRKNALGPLCVECQVSGRRLQFSPDSSRLQGGEFISLDVMTSQSASIEEPPRKLCALVITREDLLEALNSIHPRE